MCWLGFLKTLIKCLDQTLQVLNLTKLFKQITLSCKGLKLIITYLKVMRRVVLEEPGVTTEHTVVWHYTFTWRRKNNQLFICIKAWIKVTWNMCLSHSLFFLFLLQEGQRNYVGWEEVLWQFIDDSSTLILTPRTHWGKQTLSLQS